jgi:ABC-type nitrate/sulfonate/bicarbonate transport system permease component
MRQFKELAINIFYPFGKLTQIQKITLISIQLLILFTCLQFFTSLKPLDVISTVIGFLTSVTFYDDFFATLMFVAKGMFFAMLLTMLLAYLHTIEFFKAYIDFITKCRYLTFATVMTMFTMHSESLSGLKMTLLLFGTIPFFVTSFVADTSLGRGTPEYQLNKAYVNRKGKWEALFEVVIVGKLDRVFEVIRQNYAIAWMVITTVEANALNEGGIGTMVSKANRVMNLGNLMAIALLVILLGVLFDFTFGWARTALFEYVKKQK